MADDDDNLMESNTVQNNYIIIENVPKRILKV